MTSTAQIRGDFSRGRKTQNAATVIVQYVPPYRPTDGAAVSTIGQSTNQPNVGKEVAKVTEFVYNIGITATHTITVMRPLNYTWFTADAATSQAVVNIYDDPGIFQTANVYKYPMPNGLTSPSPANNGISGGDYVMYQAAAGQWVLDTVSSLATLALTLTTNLPTGGVKKGALLYFFGLTTDIDPATNEAHQQFDILPAASAIVEYKLQSYRGCLWRAYHAGDPLVFHSSNGTTQGYFELIAGHYEKH